MRVSEAETIFGLSWEEWSKVQISEFADCVTLDDISQDWLTLLMACEFTGFFSPSVRDYVLNCRAHCENMVGVAMAAAKIAQEDPRFWTRWRRFKERTTGASL